MTLTRGTGKLMRQAVLLHALLIIAPSLTGCSKLMFRKDAPAQAKSGAETARVADRAVQESLSAGDTRTGALAEDTSQKNRKDAAGQVAGPSLPSDASVTQRRDPLSREGAEPVSEVRGQGPSGFAEADDRLRQEVKPAGQVTFAYNGETITEDTVWTGRVSIQGSLTIAPQATVTISPGTDVVFRRSAGQDNAAVLLVNGRIVAQGTTEKPVRFTPDADDARSAAWHGIMFLASEKKNILEHCRIEGAATGVDAVYSTITVKNSSFSGCRTAFRAQDCLVHISGYTVSNCDLGISLYDSEAEIAGGNLFSNRIGIFAQRSSLYLVGTNMSNNDLEAVSAEESDVKIVENTFGQNGSGLALSSCEGLVSGNRIIKNRDYGISIIGSRVKVTSNDISQNGRIGIRVGDAKGIAWGNSISSNGQYDLYNAGSENFRAVGNWWGKGSDMNSPGSIYDKSVNPGSGKVLYSPVLQAKPVISP